MIVQVHLGMAVVDNCCSWQECTSRRNLSDASLGPVVQADDICRTHTCVPQAGTCFSERLRAFLDASVYPGHYPNHSKRAPSKVIPGGFLAFLARRHVVPPIPRIFHFDRCARLRVNSGISQFSHHTFTARRRCPSGNGASRQPPRRIQSELS